MAIAYYGARISPHMTRTPEGYLICHDVPINRIGDQQYLARELAMDGDPERVVTVHRYPDDVFEPAAMASFEGKDVTRNHPSENLTQETQAAYSMGHAQNIRRVGDYTVADLYIKDASLASDIESGVMREVSCGYTCTYEPDGDGFKQTRIRGNHIAVVPRGRAGHDVAIKDAAIAEKGRKNMNKLMHAILTAFGMAAKDASPEELDELVQTTATALDAAPVDPKQGAPEAKPAEPEAQPKDAVPTAEAENTMDSKLEKILEILERLAPEKKELHDESDLDDMIEKLAGEKKDPEAAVTIAAEEMEDVCKASPSQDAAVELLRRVRPAVAAIQNKAERARVVDALLSTVTGSKNAMSGIMQAAQDSARAAAEASHRTTYEKACMDSQAAYDAVNPHRKKKE